MRASHVAAAFTLATLAAHAAAADEKQVCSDAYQQAQTLRDQHKLVKAREEMRVCGRAECPGFIAKDCGNWLKDIDPRVPSVVLTAKNAAGADLTDVKVTIDGAPLATKLDGIALDVDPGAHTFAFDGADGHAEQKLVVTEGAKAQHIAVTLGGASGGTAVITTTPAAAAAGSATTAGSTTAGPGLFPPDPVDSGLSFGLRLGYALPIGSTVGGQSLSDITNGQVPLWFDAGYLVNPYLYLGAYFSVGFASAAPADCSATGVSCSGTVLRVGVDVQYRLLGKDKLQPWIGLGFLGYESASISASGFGTAESSSATGIEWVTPQAGFDYKIFPTLSAGGFIGGSIAEYFGVSEDLGTGSVSGNIVSHTLHGWFFIGARATYDLHI